MPAIEQHAGRAEQHRDMPIMAAGMHDPWILRGTGQPRRLPDRQAIDISAQADGPARLCALDDRYEPGILLGIDLIGNPQLRQLRRDALRRLHLTEAQLRMRVEFPPQPPDIRIIFFYQILDFHPYASVFLSKTSSPPSPHSTRALPDFVKRLTATNTTAFTASATKPALRCQPANGSGSSPFSMR